MEGGPLLAEWWVKASAEFVPYLNIATRLPDTPDQDLLAPMGGRGWPHFVVLDDRGTRIVPGPSHGAFRPVDESSALAAIAGAQELIARRKAAAADPRDAAAAAAVVLIEALLIEGEYVEAEVAAARTVEGVAPEILQRLAIQEVLWRYTREVQPLARDDATGRQAAYDRAADAMLAVHREGPGLFDTRERVFGDYWRLVFTGALRDDDLALAEEALKVYRRVFGTDTRLRSRLDRMEREFQAAKTRAGATSGE